MCTVVSRPRNSADAAVPVTGLDFPGVTTGAAGTNVFFGISQGAHSGLATVAPFAPYPATYIWRAFPRNVHSQNFWSSLFYAKDEGAPFTGNTQPYRFYGMHPIGDGSGRDYRNGTLLSSIPPRWEISMDGDDFVGRQVTFGQWYTQVVRVQLINAGADAQHEYFWNWPDTTADNTTTTGGLITRVQSGAGSIASPTSPLICVGANPWNPGNEIYDGILRGFQWYDAALTNAEIALELANPGSVRTPWYLCLNPTPSDITDRSGSAHHPNWPNANRPALYAA
jgi:hypothetical protein